MELTLERYIELLEDLSDTMQKVLRKLRHDYSRSGFISLDEQARLKESMPSDIPVEMAIVWRSEQARSDGSMSELVEHANENYITLTQSSLGNIRSQLESIGVTSASKDIIETQHVITQLASFFFRLSPFTVKCDWPYVSKATHQNRQDLEGGGDLLRESIEQLKEKIGRFRFFQQCLISNDDAQGTSTEPAGENNEEKPKGVSLQDAATCVCPDEPERQKKKVKEWRNNKTVFLPVVIGKDCNNKSRNLYGVDNLIIFLCEVEGQSAESDFNLRQGLNRAKRPTA